MVQIETLSVETVEIVKRYIDSIIGLNYSIDGLVIIIFKEEFLEVARLKGELIADKKWQ